MQNALERCFRARSKIGEIEGNDILAVIDMDDDYMRR